MDDETDALGQRYITSSCLGGLFTRFDGTAAPCGRVIDFLKRAIATPFCPEQAGGLATPRMPAEIVGGDGHDVLSGRARIITRDGVDVTEYFVRGAHQMLALARLTNATVAILKSKSPSCGVGAIYDGTFSGKIIEGDGVAAALLREAGLEVITEKELEDD